MRKFGVDLRFPTWLKRRLGHLRSRGHGRFAGMGLRLPRWKRVGVVRMHRVQVKRRGHLLEVWEDEVLPTDTFVPRALSKLPPNEEVLGPRIGGGVRCPLVLGRIAYGPMEGYQVNQLSQMGVPLPKPGGMTFGYTSGGTIWQIKHLQPGVFVGRSCQYAGSTAQLFQAIDALRALTPAELSELKMS